MKTAIITTLVFSILLFSASAQLQHYYKIELKYNDGEVSYRTINVVPSTETLETPGTNYLAEIIANNKAIDHIFFGIPLEILWDGINPITGKIDRGGLIKLNQSKVTLYLPYYENAKEIRIYDRDLDKKLTIDVSPFAKDTSISEPESQQNITIFLPEQININVIPEAKPTNILTPVLIGVISGIIIIFFFLILILRKKKKIEKEK